MTQYYTWPCPECRSTNYGQKPPGDMEGCIWCGAIVTVPKEAVPAQAPGQLTTLQDVGEKRVASQQQTLQALAFAKQVGARPALDEVQLYFGRPWLTIKYWYRRFKEIYPAGHVQTRPLTLNERANMKVGDDTHAWVAEVYDEKSTLLSMGYGFAMADEKTPLARGSVVEPVWPWRLAEKRAEEDALRKAVPAGCALNNVVLPTEEGEKCQE